MSLAGRDAARAHVRDDLVEVVAEEEAFPVAVPAHPSVPRVTEPCTPTAKRIAPSCVSRSLGFAAEAVAFNSATTFSVAD